MFCAHIPSFLHFSALPFTLKRSLKRGLGPFISYSSLSYFQSHPSHDRSHGTHAVTLPAFISFDSARTFTQQPASIASLHNCSYLVRFIEYWHIQVTRHATGHAVLMRSHLRPLLASLQPKPSRFIQIRHSMASHQIILPVFHSSRQMLAPSSHATLMRSAYHHYMALHSEGTSRFAQLRHQLLVAGRIACLLSLQPFSIMCGRLASILALFQHQPLFLLRASFYSQPLSLQLRFYSFVCFICPSP